MLVVDSKAIASFGKGHPSSKGNESSQEEEGERPGRDRRKEQDADNGIKRYRGKRKDGSLWEKVTKWFGFNYT